MLAQISTFMNEHILCNHMIFQYPESCCKVDDYAACIADNSTVYEVVSMQTFDKLRTNKIVPEYICIQLGYMQKIHFFLYNCYLTTSILFDKDVN